MSDKPLHPPSDVPESPFPAAPAHPAAAAKSPAVHKLIPFKHSSKSKNSLKPVKKVTTFKLFQACVASLRPG